MATTTRTLAQTLTRRTTTTTTTTAATNPLRRLNFRHAALPLTLGLTTGLLAVHHQHPMRFDAYPGSSTQLRSLSQELRKEKRELLDPEVIKQLSGGSLSGISLSNGS